MPNLDRTGPAGKGQKTGRGLGLCSNNDTIKIPVQPGSMTTWANKLGYLKEPKTKLGQISTTEMKKFALELAEALNPLTAYRMFNAQVILRKNKKGPFYVKMLVASDEIAKRYGYDKIGVGR